MSRKRPTGVLSMGWACVECAATGRTEHVPTSEEYADGRLRRESFEAGGGLGWQISTLTTAREAPAPWKIVVITGAPSWAEYWSPAMAELPQDREMVVVDRPGYAGSEPQEPVLDIRVQAQALEPLLTAAAGQKLLLVGQSYGAAIASLMAAAHPDKVDGLVLLSGYFGEPGPTAKWLVDAGSMVLRLIPKDLRHAVMEVSAQPSQLPYAREALGRVTAPLHVVHGDKDDFAPVDVAERLLAEIGGMAHVRFERVVGADHFMNNGPPAQLLAAIERCIPHEPAQPRKPRFALPRWLRDVIGSMRAITAAGQPAGSQA